MPYLLAVALLAASLPLAAGARPDQGDHGRERSRGVDEITIAFTGDTLVHLNVAAAAARSGPPFDFRPIFDPVRHLIAQADLAICHLESPLSPTSTGLSGYPRFNAPSELAPGLAHAGFDGCSTASNHSLDQGVSGALGTLDVLEDAGLEQSGMARNEVSSRNAAMYHVEGATIAQISTTYWFNGLRPPPGKTWIANELDVDRILRYARRARWSGADLVVVSLHCCVEYRRLPTTQQIESSHSLIESGNIDLVVTHHSHLVGPVERVGEEFVLHGLGNFLTGQNQFPGLSEGVIAMVTARNGVGGRGFAKVEVVPTKVERGTYRVRPAVEGDASFYRTMDAINLMGAGVGVYHLPGLDPAILDAIE